MSSTSQVLPTCVSQLCKRGECMSAFYPSSPFHCNCCNHHLCHSRLHHSQNLISQLRGGRGETRLSRNFPATSLSSPASSPSISPTSPGTLCNYIRDKMVMLDYCFSTITSSISAILHYPLLFINYHYFQRTAPFFRTFDQW